VDQWCCPGWKQQLLLLGEWPSLLLLLLVLLLSWLLLE
jgi:hypothetical protein